LKKFTAGLVLGSQILFSATLATVNGEKITDQDLMPIIGTITQGRYNTLDDETKARVQKIALEQAISQILVEKEAVKKGILKDKEFSKQLDTAVKQLKRQLISDMWLKRELDKISISTKEMKDYYKNNSSEFIKPDQVHARHILLKTEAEAVAVADSLSKFRGERLKNEFIAYAKNISTGPSAPRGGDLGYFAQGVMVPEFNDAVFSMRVGTITKKPVKTQFGYHVIYLEDKKSSENASFSEVRSLIEQKIKVEKFKIFVEDKVKYLKSKAKIREYN
jgi:peptidyl-prolyl cis-trans isomerase C